MKLHENKELFNQAIRATAQQKKLLEIYIEKDYWVTHALRTIYTSSLRDSVIFKGGTSLSKCFGLIERFSEDIDLALLRNEKDTAASLKKKLKNISTLVSETLPEITIEGITRKKGMNRKTAHAYQHSFEGEYGQVRNSIILETTWLGYFEPYVKSSISSFIYEMLEQTDQLKMADDFDLIPFHILVLAPKRTLCEKIMSLVRFSYTENPSEDLKKKIRHVYDINQILKDTELKIFFASSEFAELFTKVAIDDVYSFKNNNSWLGNHPLDALIYADFPGLWQELKTTYHGNFQKLVYGYFPEEDEILNTMKELTKRLEEIDWTPVVKELEK